MPNLYKGRPRGGQPLAERYVQAHKMRADGMSRAEVAAHFGVAPPLISSWCERVEEALADQRNLQTAGAL